MRTHYAVLGVAPSASADEVKRAYHRMARQHHPDMRAGPKQGPAGPEGHQQGPEQGPMVELNVAWAVLGDPVRRRAYDRELSLEGNVAEPSDDMTDGDALVDLFGPDPEPPPPTPADAMVLVPIALLAMAVSCFAFSTITEAPVLLLASVILLAMAGMCFVATPLLVLRRTVKRRTSTGTDPDPRS